MHHAIERRLRSRSGLQGLKLKKFRGSPRDYRAGTYMLVDADTNIIVATGDADRGYGLSLEDVANALAENCRSQTVSRTRK
jgi:hypothetical protein